MASIDGTNTGSSTLSQSLTVEGGESYAVEFVYSVTSGRIRLNSSITTSASFAAGATGRYKFNIRASSNGSTFGIEAQDAGTVAWVQAVSVKKLPLSTTASMFKSTSDLVINNDDPVQILSDFSQGTGEGPTLGPELIANGDFSSSSNWVLGTGWSITGGQAVSTVTPGSLSQTVSITSGKTYRYSIGIVLIGAVGIRLRLGDTNNQVNGQNIVGTLVGYLTAGSVNSDFVITCASTGQLTIDNVSLKEVVGNNAIQTTSGSRPFLRCRYNQWTMTENIGDAVWTKTNCSAEANSTTAPDGTMTAGKFISTSGAANLKRITRNLTTVVGKSYTDTVYAKAGELDKLVFRQGASSGVEFDLTNGTYSVLGSFYTSISMTSKGGGWYRCAATFTATATAYAAFYGPSFVNITGDNSSGFYLWGFDIRLESDFVNQPEYQGVYNTTAVSCDVVGFRPYLFFDGADDSMVTPSINFTATDSMSVFAGITKQSDALSAMFIELSTTISSNNGTFALQAPGVATKAEYRWNSKGTTDSVATYENAAVAAPVTNVLTGSIVTGKQNALS